MLKVVKVWLPPISYFLYEKRFIDTDCCLASWTALLNISCIISHARPIITLPLYTPIKAYVIVNASRVMNAFEFCFCFFFRYGSSQDTSTASII